MNGSAAGVAAALRARQRFVITSHARPDGDAVGSSVALAIALATIGKDTRVVLHDPVPAPYRDFPEMDRVVVASEFAGVADAAILLECSDPSRPEIVGLDRYELINVDHHLGNSMYGAVNWYDDTAAACGELVADIVDALGVDWTPALASHLYLAIATDTGGFRYGPISARTFEACRRIAAVGVDAAVLSRRIFDSYSIGRIKLMGALLASMDLRHDERLALLSLDDDLLRVSGATTDDAEGLVNMPLAARGVMAVALFKRQDTPQTFRVSLRSKGLVDVRSIAAAWQGGGHRNAAGCTISGELAALKDVFAAAMARAIDEAALAESATA